MHKILKTVYIPNETDWIMQDVNISGIFGDESCSIPVECHCASSYEENGRIGVIFDEEKTIPPIYDAISLFTVGDNCLTAFAVVKYNGKFGLLTCENHVIEECIYDSISYFYKPKKNSILTSSLQFVLGSEYKYIDLYSDTTIKTTNDYNYVGLFRNIYSRSPSVLSTLEWEKESFSSVYCSKKKYAVANGNSSGIIFDDGTILFESNMFKEVNHLFVHEYEYCYNLYYELRSYVRFHNGYTAWVNHEGKVFGIFDPIYKSMVNLNNYNSPYNDNYGVVVSPSNNNYSPLGECSRDNNAEYAALNVSDKWGIVDKNNNILVEFKYDSFDKLIHRNQSPKTKPIDNDKHKTRVSSRYTNEPQTFEQYRGSYAQDEMGYSDDDIDTIFDGDPLAYWNID